MQHSFILLLWCLLLLALSYAATQVAAISVTPANATEPSTAEPTMWERYAFAADPSRFPVVCKTLFGKLSGNPQADSISVTKLEQRFRRYANKSPAVRDLQAKWATLDENGMAGGGGGGGWRPIRHRLIIGDGIVNREEFCGALEHSMKVRKSSELQDISFGEDFRDRVVAFLCKFRNQFARILHDEKVGCHVKDDRGGHSSTKTSTTTTTTTTATTIAIATNTPTSSSANAVQLVKRSDKSIAAALATINILFAIVFWIQGSLAFGSLTVPGFLLGFLFVAIGGLLFFIGGTQMSRIPQIQS